ncbi:MAG: 2-hydroxy-3-oxopropionate reductase [Dehalococcoidia bacterium]|nr:2-hydroxy-3-oxopropionate reductase [Dehalococcoidia bacterium]
MTRIAFIGLGIMGRPMAGHLQAAGHELFVVRHVSPLPEELLEGGASECATAAEAASRSEVVITMVPDTPDVEEVLFGAGGVAEGLQPDTTVVDMSSISPIETKVFAARIAEKGCDYLVAPVSGGAVGAKGARRTILAGGSGETFERVRPLLELMGANITLVGDVGAGQTCKVANQIIVALTIEAVGEALLFASKAGVDPGRVREALMGGFAGSRILEVHGQRMVERTFDPGFRIALHQKDLGLALDGARALGISLPNAATAQELMNACAAQGWSDLDHSGLVKALEVLAGHEIA